MNYYQPRQILKDGQPDGWHYTCQNDGRIWAVGDCADHEPHATEAEAYDCYTGYLLNNKLRLDGFEEGVQRPCAAAGCGEWTQARAYLDVQSWPLCDSHRTKDVMAVLFGTVGNVISSW